MTEPFEGFNDLLIAGLLCTVHGGRFEGDFAVPDCCVPTEVEPEAICSAVAEGTSSEPGKCCFKREGRPW